MATGTAKTEIRAGVQIRVWLQNTGAQTEIIRIGVQI